MPRRTSQLRDRHSSRGSSLRCDAGLANGRFCPACGFQQPDNWPARMADPYVGRLIAGRYEVGELLSVGGMGRIHRGVQRSLDRAVAIKFIHAHLLTADEVATRFMTEARAASRINHPNVVSIFDFGRTAPNEGGDHYLVMELLSGRDLGRLMEAEALLPLERVVSVLRQALTALAEAHRLGIAHCDLGSRRACPCTRRPRTA